MQAVSTAAKVAITNVMAALLLKLALSPLRVKSGPYYTPIVGVASSAVDVFRNSLSGLLSVVANMMVRSSTYGPGSQMRRSSQRVDPQVVWDIRSGRRVDAAHSTSQATAEAIGIACVAWEQWQSPRRFRLPDALAPWSRP